MSDVAPKYPNAVVEYDPYGPSGNAVSLAVAVKNSIISTLIDDDEDYLSAQAAGKKAFDDMLKAPNYDAVLTVAASYVDLREM